MKRILSVLLLISVLTSGAALPVSAEEKLGICGDNLTWILDDDGTLTISGTGEMYDFYFDEPGFPITDGRHTFPWDYRELVTKVVIEDGVTSVGRNAFNCLDRITEVILPDSLKSIGDYAFAMCSSLQDISIPSSVDEFGEGVFADTPFLKKEFNENDGGLYINDILVQADTSQEGEFRVKAGTKSISPYAFWTSHHIDSIVIPASIESLSADSLNSIMNLKQVIIDEDNPYYFVEDNVIFNTDKTELIYCLITKEGEYSVPDGVKSIAYKAFSYCRINSVVMPNSVEEIEAEAFVGASIKSITLPNSLKAMGGNLFLSWDWDENYSRLDVYYDGTEKEWNNIAIGEENEYFSHATVYFLRADPDISTPEEGIETDPIDTETHLQTTDIEESTANIEATESKASESIPSQKPISKQTGDPLETLVLIFAVSLFICSVSFSVLIGKKCRKTTKNNK